MFLGCFHNRRHLTQCFNPKDIVRTGYDKVSHAYRGDVSTLGVRDRSPRLQWVNELIASIPSGGAVLELGCGNGVPVAQLLLDALIPEGNGGHSLFLAQRRADKETAADPLYVRMTARLSARQCIGARLAMPKHGYAARGAPLPISMRT